MVRIYPMSAFIDDYGITIEIETEIGLLTLLTNFPRRNKYITIRSICSLEIKPEGRLEYGEDKQPVRAYTRYLPKFIHRILMKVEKGMLYDLTTWEVVNKYRREHGGT
jgi:hypothetical protein